MNKLSPTPDPMIRNIILANEKGGAGKTMLANFLAAVALRYRYNLKIFEVDQQLALAKNYPDQTSLIRLKRMEELMFSDLADVEKLAGAFTALSAPDKSVVILDVGANLDERVSDAMLDVGLNRRIAKSGRATAVVIPLPLDADGVRCSVLTANRFTAVLPDAKILFCLRDKLDLRSVARDEVTDASVAEVIHPLIARNGLMRFPFLPASVLEVLKVYQMAPHLIGQASPQKLVDATGTHLMLAETAIERVEDMLLGAEEAAVEFLGFPRPGGGAGLPQPAAKSTAEGV